MSIALSNAYTIGRDKKDAKFVNDKTHANEPSPNKYLPNGPDETSKHLKQPTWSFPKEIPQTKDKKEPGPGSYNIPEKIVENAQYSMRQKAYPNLKVMATNTAPTDYNPKVPEKQIHYSIKGVSQSQNLEHAGKAQPGPGQYENENTVHYKGIPGSKMGKEVRKGEYLQSSTYGMPEASKYKMHDFVSDPKAGQPKYSFAKLKRFEAVEQGSYRHQALVQPGPGHYQEKRPLTSGVPQYSMPGRRADLRPKTGKGVPGPNQHNPSYSLTKKKAPDYRIGTSFRDGEVGIFKQNPGPTQYDHHNCTGTVRAKSSSWRIGSEHRPKQQQYVPPTPGPGNYEIKSMMGNGVPNYFMGEKSKGFIKDSPGPGAYMDRDEPTKLKAPNFSMGKDNRDMLQTVADRKRRTFKKGLTPGHPGAGQHEHISQLSGSKWGFGTGKRDAFKPKGTPGPGAYDHIPQVGNHNDCSMQNRNLYGQK